MTRISETENTFSFPVCNSCKNHLGDDKCLAFDKIPEEILEGRNNHSKPLKDQGNNIVFELIE